MECAGEVHVAVESRSSHEHRGTTAAGGTFHGCGQMHDYDVIMSDRSRGAVLCFLSAHS